MITQKRFPEARVAALPPSREPASQADLAAVARRLAEVRLTLPAGAWDPDTAPAAARTGFGTFVLAGLLTRALHLDGVPAAQLVVPGDVHDPFGRRDAVLSDGRVTWHVLEDAVVAVLGARFLAAARRYPALTVALHRRQIEQHERAVRHAAVAQLPRVEQRIVALLRGLAEERGRVGVDGVVVDLPLTHAGIGRLIGAKRPTVSLALKALAEDGTVTGGDGRWLIARGAAGLAEAPAAAGPPSASGPGRGSAAGPIAA